MLKIVLKRSYIGTPEKHRKILRALGLRKIGGQVTMAENSATKGMIRLVSHMISVEKTDE